MPASQAQTFGLPTSLQLPIAAIGTAAIERFVGSVELRKSHRGLVTAAKVRVRSEAVAREPGVGLWKQAGSDLHWQRLHPPFQLWVHVDYTGYREAWVSMGMPAIQAGYFLDHVQNRIAIRLRGRTHPYLRLCPVSRRVNTSGGHDSGGEGMEKAYLRDLETSNPAKLAELSRADYPVIYADPMDITKMLNIPPGTEILDGVRETQRLFYP